LTNIFIASYPGDEYFHQVASPMQAGSISASGLLARWRGGLIVSCQALPGSPFDNPESIAAFALAAEASGAVGLRIEGVRNVEYVAGKVKLPIVGIVKRDRDDTPVRITPEIADVGALAAAGATVIAVDATARPRPVAAADLIAAIHDAGRLAMADIATLDEGLAAAAAGADFVASTLSGYTGGGAPEAPDLDLVQALAAAGLNTVAEGNYRTPEQAALAIGAGALAVTVGSAITRPEHVTQWFAAAIAKAARPHP